MAKANKHPADILADVTKRGSNLTKLAKAADLHPSTLWHSLHRCVPAGNKVIATYLGASPHDLWPEWFDSRGRRLRKGPTRPDGIRKPRAAKRQNVEDITDKRSAA